MSWQSLVEGNRELAEYGVARFASRVAYLATVGKDGSPRVHPITPFLAQGRLLVGMEETSPKGKDLQRDGRFALHCGVEDDDGGKGEFFVSGRAEYLDDPEHRALARKHAPYDFLDRYILFELQVEKAVSKVYEHGGAKMIRWSQAGT